MKINHTCLFVSVAGSYSYVNITQSTKTFYVKHTEQRHSSNTIHSEP